MYINNYFNMHTNSFFLDFLFYIIFGYVVIKIVNMMSFLKQEYIDMKNSISSIKTSLDGLNKSGRSTLTIASSISESLYELNNTVVDTHRNNNSGVSTLLQPLSQLATTFVPILLSALIEQLRHNGLAGELFNQCMRTRSSGTSESMAQAQQNVQHSESRDTVSIPGAVTDNDDASSESGSQHGTESVSHHENDVPHAPVANN